MTLEKRIVFTPGDVQALSIVCKGCGHDVGFDISKEAKNLPTKCPWCHEEWNEPPNPLRQQQWTWLESFFRLAIEKSDAHEMERKSSIKQRRFL